MNPTISEIVILIIYFVQKAKKGWYNQQQARKFRNEGKLKSRYITKRNCKKAGRRVASTRNYEIKAAFTRILNYFFIFFISPINICASTMTQKFRSHFTI